MHGFNNQVSFNDNFYIMKHSFSYFDAGAQYRQRAM